MGFIWSFGVRGSGINVDQMIDTLTARASTYQYTCRAASIYLIGERSESEFRGDRSLSSHQSIQTRIPLSACPLRTQHTTLAFYPTKAPIQEIDNPAAHSCENPNPNPKESGCVG